MRKSRECVCVNMPLLVSNLCNDEDIRKPLKILTRNKNATFMPQNANETRSKNVNFLDRRAHNLAYSQYVLSGSGGVLSVSSVLYQNKQLKRLDFRGCFVTAHFFFVYRTQQKWGNSIKSRLSTQHREYTV